MSGDKLALGAAALLAAWSLTRRGSANTPGVDAPYAVGPIVFDAKEGFATTGYNMNIDYRGFVVWMRPSEFLRLAPPLSDSEIANNWFVGRSISGSKVPRQTVWAPPFITVEPVDDVWHDYFGTLGKTDYRCRGHEGRHRMHAIQELVGDDVQIPVHVVVEREVRARHLDPHLLLGSKLLPDPRIVRFGFPATLPVKIKSLTHQGKRYPEGSANVVTDKGYHRTAINGTGASAPLKHLIKHKPDWISGRVLDFGTGKGRDCAALKKRNLQVACYDPHHPSPSTRTLPSGQFDVVLSTYVVNVLPKKEREAALRQMAKKVKKGGVLCVSARGCGDSSGLATAKTWKKHSDGYAQFDGNSLSRFQRFFTGEQLSAEIRAILGSSFSPISIPPMGASTALACFRRL